MPFLFFLNNFLDLSILFTSLICDSIKSVNYPSLVIFKHIYIFISSKSICFFLITDYYCLMSLNYSILAL